MCTKCATEIQKDENNLNSKNYAAQKAFPRQLTISCHIVLAAKGLAKWVPLFFAIYFISHGSLIASAFTRAARASAAVSVAYRWI